MIIKKNTLYHVLCPLIICLLVGDYIVIAKKNALVDSERAHNARKEAFQRDFNKEYSKLLFEYNSIVKTINDSNYSYDFRCSYVHKLNLLLGENRYITWQNCSSDCVWECISRQKSQNIIDKKILRQQVFCNLYQTYPDIIDELADTYLQSSNNSNHLNNTNNPYIAHINNTMGNTYGLLKMSKGFSKTNSGLIYLIDNPGIGDRITKDDNVTLNYIGELINGTIFSKEKFATLSSKQTIEGFSEALSMLGEGGRMTAVIPPNLAYGLDAPAFIGPNSTLIFHIEIISVNTSETKDD